MFHVLISTHAWSPEMTTWLRTLDFDDWVYGTGYCVEENSIYYLYSFKNEADSVFFKLKWCAI